MMPNPMTDKMNDLVDPKAADYWLEVVTRGELEPLLARYNALLVQLDLCFGYLMERLDIKPEEIRAWAEARAAATNDPNLTPRVTKDE